MNTKALSWILSNKTGIPSKTIWYVMMNVTAPAAEEGSHFDVPYDRAVFSHRYNLLVKVPEWRARLQEVADVFQRGNRSSIIGMNCRRCTKKKKNATQPQSCTT